MSADGLLPARAFRAANPHEEEGRSALLVEGRGLGLVAIRCRGLSEGRAGVDPSHSFLRSARSDADS